MTDQRPTIEELEAILNSDDDRNVMINPDGTITVTDRLSPEAQAALDATRQTSGAALDQYSDSELLAELARRLLRLP